MTTTDPWATTDHDPADHDIHAVSEAEPAELIFAARDQFLAKLGDSLTALTQARWHLAQLRGNELYDIDFADSDDGADIDRLLDDARRLIHGAAGITLRVADHT